MTGILAERLQEKRRNEKMWSDGGPAQPSPTIGQAINGGFLGLLEAKCNRCDRVSLVALRALKHRPDTPVWKLEAALYCEPCSEGPALQPPATRAYSRANLRKARAGAIEGNETEAAISSRESVVVVPELTRRADIKLNERVLLRLRFELLTFSKSRGLARQSVPRRAMRPARSGVAASRGTAAPPNPLSFGGIDGSHYRAVATPGSFERVLILTPAASATNSTPSFRSLCSPSRRRNNTSDTPWPTRRKRARQTPQFSPVLPLVGRRPGCRRPRSRLRAPPLRDVPIPRPAPGETSFEGDGRPQFDGTTKLSRGIGARSPRRLPSSSLNSLSPVVAANVRQNDFRFVSGAQPKA